MNLSSVVIENFKMSFIFNLITSFLVILIFLGKIRANSTTEFKGYIQKIDGNFRKIVHKVQHREKDYRCQIKNALTHINLTLVSLISNKFALSVIKNFVNISANLSDFFKSYPFALNDTETIREQSNCDKIKDSIVEYENVTNNFISLESYTSGDSAKIAILFNETRENFNSVQKNITANQKWFIISTLLQINKTIALNDAFQIELNHAAENISNILTSLRPKVIDYCVQKDTLNQIFGQETTESVVTMTSTMEIDTVEKTTRRILLKKGKKKNSDITTKRTTNNEKIVMA